MNFKWKIIRNMFINLHNKQQTFIFCIVFLFFAIVLSCKSYGDKLEIFYSIRNSLVNTGNIIEEGTEIIIKSINKQADGYKNERNESYRIKAIKLENLEKDFHKYILDIQKIIIDSSGGITNEDKSKYANEKDKYIVGSIMGINNPIYTVTLGFELEQKIKNLRTKLIDLCNNDSTVVAGLPLNIDGIISKVNKKNWADYEFRNIPMVVSITILSKIELDAKFSCNRVMEYLLSTIKSDEIVYDKYALCIATKSPYVIKGEKFEADIFFANYASKLPANSSFWVNNDSIQINHGVAKYSHIIEKPGINTIKAKAFIKNNMTGEIKSVISTFDFEVANNSNLISTDQKDILYIGIDNPIFISPIGIDPNKVKVNILGQPGASYKKIDINHYKVKVTEETKEGEYCYITVSGKGYTDKKAFIVKHLSDPKAHLGKLKSGQISVNDFKSLTQVNAVMQDFEYDVKCKVTGFNMIRIPKEKQLVKHSNEGFAYNQGCKELAKQAVSGDVYCFEKVKARCPGDLTDRTISPLVFNIK